MKIVADENMPLVKELFAPFGEVELLPGREMNASHVWDADVLLVRSVTLVNASLLEGSNVQFVGTATIGIDHVDTDYLKRRGIGFASAPGCNANAVVQYVLAALCQLMPDWQGKTLGIIGCGNVGKRLYKTLVSLGVDCRCYDPFLTRDQIPDLTTLDKVLGCDAICCHTPLTNDGPFPTFHLLDETRLAQLAPGTLLINAGRGAVVDNRTLLKLLLEGKLRAVLDVWESEPKISLELLQVVDIGTPHIAGYSYDGKVNGTAMMRDALCQWQGELAVPREEPVAPQPLPVSSVREAVLSAYDIISDDRQMRETLLAEGADIAQLFDQLRKNYHQRLEFQHYHPTGQLAEEELLQLRSLGFG